MHVTDNDLSPGIEELSADGISRRRFLALLSSSAALALGTSCSKIDRGTIVPYTRRPGEIIPGVAEYYASAFQEGIHAHGILVKTREGRPIHIEGNAEHPISRGKTSYRAMGDLLGLYDPDRLRAPSFKSQPSTWEDAIQAIARVFINARSTKRPVILLTGAVVSPTQRSLISDLRSAVPALRHVAWEPCAPQTEIAAARDLFGNPIVPTLRFDRADLVLSFQADFLGNDPNAPFFIQDFASRRKISTPDAPMNRLWVVEGMMTLTGANADQRLRVRPSQIAPLAFVLARMLNELHSIDLPPGIRTEGLNDFEPTLLTGELGIELSTLSLLAADLAAARESALVVAGPSLPPEAHIACCLLNRMLGSDGNTIDMSTASSAPELLTYSGFQDLLEDAAQGAYGAALFCSANPAYSFPNSSLWKRALESIPESFRIGLYEDETALDCNWRLPEHHWLEDWGDFEAAPDFLSLRQPTIGPIYDTRQAEDILLAAMKAMKIEVPQTYLEYIKARWQRDVYPTGSPVSFDIFWNAALHDGGVRAKSERQPMPVMNPDTIERALAAAADYRAAGSTNKLELVLFPGAGVFDGRYANNGWLNELPDPVAKTTWSNPALISISDAERLGVRDEDTIMVSSSAGSVEAPVIVQAGQAPGVAALALGYGRRTGNIAVGVGTNAYTLIDSSSPFPFLLSGIAVDRNSSGKKLAVSRTQKHNLMEGRDLARSWTLRAYSQRANEEAKHDEHGNASLIPSLEFPDYKWGMVIDLSACVGCSACVIACQSENNISVVGPERIQEGREMHWIRIDRYYEGDLQNPSVVHQPMLCQHCENAPCEIVCPVNATTHSPDGLNQMVYNRCVGTRYCSNNCPFKVRRFNFFDYTSMKKEPESLVYNPEVSVRPRGVMEKCSFCIQRIQNAKQIAKVQDRIIEDGEIRPACAVACPSGAIVFGDMKDAKSRVSVLSKTNRNYHLLDDLGVKSSITYLADISNPADEKGEA